MTVRRENVPVADNRYGCIQRLVAEKGRVAWESSIMRVGGALDARVRLRERCVHGGRPGRHLGYDSACGADRLGNDARPVSGQRGAGVGGFASSARLRRGQGAREALCVSAAVRDVGVVAGIRGHRPGHAVPERIRWRLSPPRSTVSPSTGRTSLRIVPKQFATRRLKVA